MMRTFLIGAMLVAFVAPFPSHARTIVRFVDPGHYTDVASSDDPLAVFRTYLERLSERYLPPGQNLTIDILDIDLAGEYEPWRPSFSDVRVVRDTTPPRFKLRYTLAEKGKRLRSGEAHLSDMNFQMNPSARVSSDRYAYEKALLEDWFRQTFAPGR
jgi:hypothetical protein